MYLPAELKLTVKDINPLTILHIGAHFGEEAPYYDSLSPQQVVWIEANPRAFRQLTIAVRPYGHRVVNALLSDTTGDVVQFHIANNGQSSSMLPLKEHLISHPDVFYTGNVTLTTKRLDDLQLGQFTVLNIDVQGAEMQVLRGGLETLKSVRVLYAEINFREMYEGCHLVDAFDAELSTLGFSRTHTFDTGSGWGDAIYVRTVATDNKGTKR